MSDRFPHVREPSSGEPDICIYCREEWVDLLTLYETDECSVRLRAELATRCPAGCLSHPSGFYELRCNALSAALDTALTRAATAERERDNAQRTAEAAEARHEERSRLLSRALARAEEAERERDEARRERAAVVAWLREHGDQRRATLADRIERGEHRREETK